jgi:hypothetical protein
MKTSKAAMKSSSGALSAGEFETFAEAWRASERPGSGELHLRLARIDVNSRAGGGGGDSFDQMKTRSLDRINKKNRMGEQRNPFFVFFVASRENGNTLWGVKGDGNRGA